MNTLNDPENPAYLGDRISLETNKYISPFTSGISMPKFLFKHNVKLLKNTLLLSTELSKSECKNSDLGAEKNSTDILKLFLSLLFQPYTIWENKGYLQIIVKGITPLSRFASSYYEGIHCQPCFFENEFLSIFVKEFKRIVDENHYKMQCIPSISKIPDKESDIPIFKPTLVFDGIKLLGDGGKSVLFGFEFPEIFYKDTITPEYELLANVLCSIDKYCKYDFKVNGDTKLVFKNKSAFFSDTPFLNDLRKLSKQLVIDTLNTYTSNIQFKLDHFNKNDMTVEEKEKYIKTKNEYPNSNSYMYSFAYQSPSLLQSLFFETSKMLNEYGVGICALPECNNLFFYKRTRPKRCCSQRHNDLYCKRKKKKPSKNLKKSSLS